jgi:hypothetical protein
MTLTKIKLPLLKRRRRRQARDSEDPCVVFRTFVQLLAQMRAQGRNATSEKG